MDSGQSSSQQGRSVLLLYRADREVEFVEKSLLHWSPKPTIHTCRLAKDRSVQEVFQESCKIIENQHVSLIINK